MHHRLRYLKCMSSASHAAAVLLLMPSIEAWAQQTTLAPSYSSASIVNAATNQASGFAPNSIVSIYGTNLSFNTVAMSALQTSLPKSLGGVTVYLGGTPAYLFYVSPKQINFLVPASLIPQVVNLSVLREGTAGPPVSISLTSAAPGFFQLTSTTLLATHVDGTVIAPTAPAKDGETIIIYATGLGATVPDFPDGALPDRAALIANVKNLAIVINSVLVDSATIQYAGVTPGCAGLYQINLVLPIPLPPYPEIRVGIGPQVSPSGTLLPTLQGPPQ